MTKAEQHLIDTTEYLKDIGLETFLIGSTLLQFIRSGEIKERHRFDRELNIGCLDEDLTDKMIKRIKKDHAWCKMNEDEDWNFRKRTILYFGNNDPKKLWGAKGFFTLLVPFFLKGSSRVEYVGADICMAWPKRHCKKFGTIDYRGYTLNTPNDPKGWLEHYFGPDWREENLNWYWQTDAKNVESLVNL